MAPFRTHSGPAALVLLLAALSTVAVAAPVEALAEEPGAAWPLHSETARWPLDPAPEVVGGFAPPSSPWGAGHRGVDLLGRAGQRVVAAAAGTVTFAGPLAGRGVVVVDHGRTRTTYEPVRASVVRGDKVAAGDPIGRLEPFGSHCPPRACLHWGLLEGERYLDPLTLLGRGPVRLLPLFGDAGLVVSGAPRPAMDDRAAGMGAPGPVLARGSAAGRAALFRHARG